MIYVEGLEIRLPCGSGLGGGSTTDDDGDVHEPCRGRPPLPSRESSSQDWTPPDGDVRTSFAVTRQHTFERALLFDRLVDQA